MSDFTYKARRTKDYMREQARPLEGAQYRLLFSAGTADDVFRELVQFQNGDGGFGRGLEPDCLMPASSPLASSRAFQLLRQYGGSVEMETVARAMHYLANSFDVEYGGWKPVSKEVNEYPHAPWWHQDESTTTQWGNPTAELAGYVHLYRELIASTWHHDLTNRVLQRFYRLDPESTEAHEVLCYFRFLDILGAWKDSEILAKARTLFAVHQTCDREQWAKYGVQALEFFKHCPFLCEENEGLAHDNLDFWLDSLSDDGVWYPNWHWGQFAEEWEAARLAWAGILTVERMQCIKRFDRTIDSFSP